MPNKPSVIATSDAAVFDLAVVQGGAAMTASWIDEAELAARCFEQDQILTEHAH